jgi:hypothetical protein
MGEKPRRTTLNIETTSTLFLFVTKFKCEDGKHQEEEEEQEVEKLEGQRKTRRGILNPERSSTDFFIQMEYIYIKKFRKFLKFLFQLPKKNMLTYSWC